MIVLNIDPCPKPRMTQQDRWKKRPRVVRYWQYKDKLRELNPEINWDPLSIHFVMPMPKSWSKKKRKEMDGKPHITRPDLDNLIKAFQDAILDEDSQVWRYGKMIKTWGEKGQIILDPQFIPSSY